MASKEPINIVRAQGELLALLKRKGVEGSVSNDGKNLIASVGNPFGVTLPAQFRGYPVVIKKSTKTSRGEGRRK